MSYSSSEKSPVRKPTITHQQISGVTLVPEDEKKPTNVPESDVKPPAGPTSNELSASNATPLAVDNNSVLEPDQLFHQRLYDLLLLAGIFIMLAWPWVFFGVVFALHGLQASNHFSNVIRNNPHAVSFFSTLVANVITLMIDVLFSFSVVRFAQEWFSTNETETTTLHVSIILAFRHLSWPWTLEDLKTVHFQKIKLLLALLITTILCITFVPSSINSLITPAPYNRTAELHGTELDFTVNSPECTNWLATHPIPDGCDWGTYNGLRYTTCLGENQMVDVLEAGRGSILSLLTNNNQSLSFSQLSNAGLHFLGPIRGVLPIGPDGVPAFDTLKPSPLSNRIEREGMISYNYTLAHQGLSSNVTCFYDDDSPIRLSAINGIPSAILYQYNGTCNSPSLDDIFDANKAFVQFSSNNTLLSWTCKSKQAISDQPSYYIYLRAIGQASSPYQTSVGNMTCVISPIQPAVFNLTYQSTPNTFTSQSENISTSPSFSFPGFLDRAMQSVVAIVWEAQNWEANLVAESVITFGVKQFNLTSDVRSNQYLRLYEAMIRGIIEYEATYARLLYSARATNLSDMAPSSCFRDVSGTTTFAVQGWSVTLEHIGFLMPITLMCLCSLVILILAMMYSKERRKQRLYYPTGIRPLLFAYMPQDTATPGTNTDSHPSPWTQKIKYCYQVATKDIAEKAKDLGLDNLKGAMTDLISS